MKARIHNQDYAMCYVMWLLGGWFGLHRFYLRGPQGATVVMALLPLTVVLLPVSLVWWFIDLFLIEDLYIRTVYTEQK